MARIIAGEGFRLLSYVTNFASIEAGLNLRFTVGRDGDDVVLTRFVGTTIFPPDPDTRIILRGEGLVAQVGLPWQGRVTGFDVLQFDGFAYRRLASAEGVDIPARAVERMLSDASGVVSRLKQQIDSIVGTPEADRLDYWDIGLPNVRDIDFGGGNDSFRAGYRLGVTTIDGGAGNDLLSLDLFAERLLVDAATGLVRVDGETMYRAFGFERWLGIADRFVFNGTNRAERIEAGGSGDDTLQGNGGNDTLIGDGQRDLLFGGQGADVLQDGLGHGFLAGGGGQDMLVLPREYDRRAADIDLSAGTMTSDPAGRLKAVSQKLAGIEHATGGGQDDRLLGSDVPNILAGGRGDDVLRGRQADDSLSGGDGTDTLSGDRGADLLDGGAGDDLIMSAARDRLVFRRGDGHDVVEHGGGRLTVTIDAGVALDSPAELRAALRQDADGTVLTYQGGRASILFHAMTPADVMALSFVFVD